MSEPICKKQKTIQSRLPGTDSGPVLFFRPHLDNGYLSNWSMSPFTIDGRRFNGMEQWYMWNKARMFEDAEMERKIMKSSNPRSMKAFGRRVRGYSDDRWDPRVYPMLLEGLQAKFEQNPELRQRLLDTGERPIAEASPYDRFCGIGIGVDHRHAQDPTKWPGRNILGRALVAVRHDLRVAAAQEETAANTEEQ